MSKDKVAQASVKVAATHCAHCRRELPSGEGVEIPFIGAVGPECAEKFAPLAALLQQVQAVTSPTTGTLVDPETDFPVWALGKLHALGFAAHIVTDDAGDRRVEVLALRPASKKVGNRAAAALAAFGNMRAAFEERLMLAAADAQARAEAAAPAAPKLGRPAVAALRGLGLPVNDHGQQCIPLTGNWLAAAEATSRRAEALGLQVHSEMDLTAGVYRLQLGGAA